MRTGFSYFPTLTRLWRRVFQTTQYLQDDALCLIKWVARINAKTELFGKDKCRELEMKPNLEICDTLFRV